MWEEAQLAKMEAGLEKYTKKYEDAIDGKPPGVTAEQKAKYKDQRDFYNRKVKDLKLEFRLIAPPPPPPVVVPMRSPALPRTQTSEQVTTAFFATEDKTTWLTPTQAVFQPLVLPKGNRHANQVKKFGGAVLTQLDPGAPTMLFSQLGVGYSPRSTGPTLKSRLGDSNPVILLGPSGSGKTRKIFDLFAEKHGFYLTWRIPFDKNPGSFALTNVLSRLDRFFPETDWTTQNPTKELSSQRREDVGFAIKCILAAYALVYKEWSSSAGEKVEPLQWLYAQLFPEMVFKKDIFALLAERLVTKCIRESNFDGAFQSTRGFTCALDETQVLGSMMESMFVSEDDGTTLRPLLSPAFKAVFPALGVHPIVSGTGLSLVKEWGSFISATGSASPVVRSVFNDFHTLTPIEVKAELKSYLNTAGQSRVAEAAEWLAGRPRFVATFIEEVIGKNVTVDEHLDVYVESMLVEKERRTAGWMWARLAREPELLNTMGVAGRSPLWSALDDAYLASCGADVIRSDNLEAVEVGLGYAGFVTDSPYIGSNMRFEPLVLEAAARFRARISDSTSNSILSHAGLSASVVGTYFEYAVGDVLCDALLPQGKPMEKSLLLNNVEMPAAFKGEWERPTRRFGRVAYSGDDANFFAWMDDVLNPASETVRVRYPGIMAGPDIVIVLRDKDHKRVMVVLVQAKLAKKVESAEALLRVDPAKIFHKNRGKPDEAALLEYETKHKAFLARLERDSVPVMRVLVSGKTRIKDMGSGLVSHNRGGKKQDDLLLVVDNTQTKEFWGEKLATVIEALAKI